MQTYTYIQSSCTKLGSTRLLNLQLRTSNVVSTLRHCVCCNQCCSGSRMHIHGTYPQRSSCTRAASSKQLNHRHAHSDQALLRPAPGAPPLPHPANICCCCCSASIYTLVLNRSAKPGLATLTKIRHFFDQLPGNHNPSTRQPKHLLLSQPGLPAAAGKATPKTLSMHTQTVNYTQLYTFKHSVVIAHTYSP
jgi:hypothetical protein